MALSTVLFVGETKNWLPEIVEKASKLKCGSGLDPATEVGPLIRYGINRWLNHHGVLNATIFVIGTFCCSLGKTCEMLEDYDAIAATFYTRIISY